MSSSSGSDWQTRYYEPASRLYAGGDYEASLQLVERGLDSRPDGGLLWELKGLLHFAVGELELAIEAIEEATLLIPLSHSARVCLGFSYLKTGSSESARTLFDLLADDETVSVELLLQIAAGYDQLDLPPRAMQVCRTASRRDPQLAQPYYDLGYYSARCGLPESTTEALARKAISLDPDHLGYRVGFCGFLLKQGRSNEAYRIAIAIDDRQLSEVNCRCCLERIADLFQQVGDYRRNILCRQRLLELELAGDADGC